MPVPNTRPSGNGPVTLTVDQKVALFHGALHGKMVELRRSRLPEREIPAPSAERRGARRGR